jgi:membrane-bound lytic murein transglycosylase A
VKGLRRFAALVALVALSACATRPPAPTHAPYRAPPVVRPYQRPHVQPPERSRPPPPAAAPAPEGADIPLSALPGWYAEDYSAALNAFVAGCSVSRDPAVAAVCRDARETGPLPQGGARLFLERNFRAHRVGDTGLLTAYFVPEYEGRETPEPPFTAAVRPRPSGLEARRPMGDRAAIEATPPEQALAWMKPEDLFIMQIQGSGVLDLPDGRRLKASVSVTNGLPFVAIGGILRQRGDLPAKGASGDAIRTWLAEHRGPEADAVMDQNPRYVFFGITPDDGREPAGTAGIPLVAGRSIAIDPGFHDFGGAYWIDADSAALNGAPALYRRLVVALDTGGAIKGPVRADLYLGRGPQAGDEAGRVKHVLKLYALVPIQP